MTIGREALRALIVALALALPAAATAGAAPEAVSVEQLMQRLSQVKSAKARFVERKTLRILNAPLESSGVLTYTAPHHLEKRTLAPKAETLVLDKDTLTFEDVARNRRRTLRLQDFPVVWAFVESIRATLAGDLQALNRHYRVSVDGDEASWRLTLEPREPGMQNLVQHIRIAGTRASVRTIEVEEAEGDRSLMTILEEK